SYELPDSKKSYADIMREAGGGRRTGLRTKPVPPVIKQSESEKLIEELLATLGRLCRLRPVVYSVLANLGLAAAFVVLALAMNWSTGRIFWLWLGLFSPAFLALSLLAERDYQQFRPKLDAAINGSSLADRLIMGAHELPDIHQYIRLPFPFMVVGFKPRNLTELARLVATNLDWYLAEPKPVIRLSWILNYLSLMAMLAYTTLAFYQISSHQSPGAIVMFLVVCPYFFVAIMMYTARKTSYGAAKLLAQLRERFVDFSKRGQ
ncbi:hypothetical protein JW859_10315, partial [bacterium]|nr:hypothetical protein [bacterium]